MKIIYFDCFSGVSGDMALGALLDLMVVDIEYLKRELERLPVSGYSIGCRREARHHIFGTRFSVRMDKKDQRHRTFSGIERMIGDSTLNDGVKEMSLKVFRRLAGAEAKVHNVKVMDVCFHEVGAIDSIIDIVGVSIAIDAMGIEGIYSSSLPVGYGFVETAHGSIPIPAPATIEVLMDFPVISSDIKQELTTPTGAALMSTLSLTKGEMPPLKVMGVGYGVGRKDFAEQPNLLRVIVGEKEERFGLERLTVMETNIDDMNPQVYDYIMERLLESGALEVFLSPIQMKKNRPGVLLKVISDEGKRDELARIIFEESTTIGIRSYSTERIKLSRDIRTIDTSYGKVRVKVSGRDANVFTIQPEYEDCKRIAKERKLPLKSVIEEVKMQFRVNPW